MRLREIKNKSFFLPYLMAFVLIKCFSCTALKKHEQGIFSVELITDTISNPYIYFSEIKVQASHKLLIENIQRLSENKSLSTTNPEERLQKKITYYQLCREADISDCNYTPEDYKILSYKNNILNVEYVYNAFSSPDEYYKYAAFNITNGERITGENIFKNPQHILQAYNDKYTSEIKSYLESIKTNQERWLDESEMYQEHLETRSLFQLEDLDNLELIYDTIEGNFIQLNFHYNGQGGLYRQYLGPGSIDFTIEELKPLLSKKFKKQVGI